MKLLSMPNVTCHAGSLYNVLCDVVNIETRQRLIDDEDGFDHCVGVRALKGDGLFLRDDDSSARRLMRPEIRSGLQFRSHRG
jgi:hypothetical protein